MHLGLKIIALGATLGTMVVGGLSLRPEAELTRLSDPAAGTSTAPSPTPDTRAPATGSSASPAQSWLQFGAALNQPRAEDAPRQGNRWQSVETRREPRDDRAGTVTETATSLPAVVVTASHTRQQAPAAAPAPPARHELVRDLQRELTRVGCYAGDVDGDWGPGSRRGMRAFLDQVNPGLQSEEPDLLQLTLIRGRFGQVCRAGGAGMVASRNPPAAPLPTPAPSGSIAVVTPTPTTPTAPTSRVVPLEGRMAVGGPVPSEPESVTPPAPGTNAAPPPAPVQRATPPPRPRPAPSQQRAPRSDTSWTRSFFDR